jgi:hypothetical protein
LEKVKALSEFSRVKKDPHISTLVNIERRIQSLQGENRKQYTDVIEAIRTKVMKLKAVVHI